MVDDRPTGRKAGGVTALLRTIEKALIDLVADTGDLAEDQQPIMARHQLLDLLQQVQAALADNSTAEN